MNCSLNAWSTFVSNNYINTNCIQYCPLECYSITYSVTTRSTNYPSYNYALDSLMTNPIVKSKFQNETLTYDLLKESVLSLNIYYDKLTYTGITKDTKTELIDLISNIGGLLGLFLDISFLSFVEIIEIIFETLVIILSKHRINN